MLPREPVTSGAFNCPCAAPLFHADKVFPSGMGKFFVSLAVNVMDTVTVSFRAVTVASTFTVNGTYAVSTCAQAPAAIIKAAAVAAGRSVLTSLAVFIKNRPLFEGLIYICAKAKDIFGNGYGRTAFWCHLSATSAM